jgi:hypothetical protein
VQCLPSSPEGPSFCYHPTPLVPVGRGDPCGGECGAELCFQLYFARSGACPLEEGLFCSPSSGVCEERSPAGGPCLAYSSACESGAYCDPGSCPFPEPSHPGSPPCLGTCRRLPAVGEECAGGFECADGSYCRYDYDCESDCVPTCAEPGPLGASCEPFDFRACADGLACSHSTRRCERPVLAGDPCDPGSFRPCDAFDLFCDEETRTCRVLGGEGAACSRDEECSPFLYPLYCENGRCSRRKREGERCSRREACLSLDCSTDAGGPTPTPDTGALAQVAEGVCRRTYVVHPFDCGVPPSPTPAFPSGTPTAISDAS